jgi:hypothetical protein
MRKRFAIRCWRTAQLLDKTIPGARIRFRRMSEWNWEEQNPVCSGAAKYENDHRTVYMMVQRSVKHPYMTLFDGPDANASTAQRNSSLTPLQALYFLNAPFPSAARTTWRRLLDDQASDGGEDGEGKRTGGGSDESELDRAFMISMGGCRIRQSRSVAAVHVEH